MTTSEITAPQALKDSLQNFQDLQTFAENLGFTDLFLSPATRKKTAKEQARLFPMDAKQRRELFLALQEHPTYKVAKFDTITHYEAEAILDYLKGKSLQKPDKLSVLYSSASSLSPRTLGAITAGSKIPGNCPIADTPLCEVSG